MTTPTQTKPGAVTFPAGLQQIRQDLWNFVVVDGGGRNNTMARNTAYAELGLMERVQRAPAMWQLSDAGQAIIDHWRNETGLPCAACGGNAFVSHASGDPQDSHRCPECNGTGYAARPDAGKTPSELAAEVESLRAGLSDMEATARLLAIERAEFRREAERLAKDAARYRWLRDGNYPIGFARSVLNDTPHGIDAAIDDAIHQCEGAKA